MAERFEVFCQGIEVANGYRELTDPTEQRQRFRNDRDFRARLARPDVIPDEDLLAALEHGLPDCAGVAVGFDRVVMVLLGLGHNSGVNELSGAGRPTPRTARPALLHPGRRRRWCACPP